MTGSEGSGSGEATPQNLLAQFPSAAIEATAYLEAAANLATAKKRSGSVKRQAAAIVPRPEREAVVSATYYEGEARRALGLVIAARGDEGDGLTRAVWGRALWGGESLGKTGLQSIAEADLLLRGLAGRLVPGEPVMRLDHRTAMLATTSDGGWVTTLRYRNSLVARSGGVLTGGVIGVSTGDILTITADPGLYGTETKTQGYLSIFDPALDQLDGLRSPDEHGLLIGQAAIAQVLSGKPALATESDYSPEPIWVAARVLAHQAGLLEGVNVKPLPAAHADFKNRLGGMVEACLQRKPFNDSLVQWPPGYLRSLLEVTNTDPAEVGIEPLCADDSHLERVPDWVTSNPAVPRSVLALLGVFAPANT